MKINFRILLPLVLLLAAWLALSACGEDLDNARVQQLLAEGGTPAPPAPPPAAVCGDPGTLVTVDHFDRGWWNDSLNRTSTNQNTITGWAPGSTYNSYLQFDLSTITGTVTQVTLRFELADYSSPDASETISIWDVTTDSASLDATSGPNPAIFADLMSGANYGNHSVSFADVTGVFDVPLSCTAVADVNAALGGTFAVGLNLTSLALGGIREAVWFSTGVEIRTHQLLLTVQ